MLILSAHFHTTCLTLLHVPFTATPKIKRSKGRSDTMSEGGEGKLLLCVDTIVFFVLNKLEDILS